MHLGLSCLKKSNNLLLGWFLNSKEQDRIRATYGPLFKIQSITGNDKVYFGLKEKKYFFLLPPTLVA